MIKAVIFDMYETLITHYDCPLYFNAEMAKDAEIDVIKFQRTWHGAENDRTIGKLTLEEVIEKILRENNCYTEEKFNKIVQKRYKIKEELFYHLDSEIIPMLTEINNRGVKIGLITNCFSEEAKAIKQSVLYKYFDVTCLSCVEGIQKPDQRIFKLCLDRLGLKAGECLYIGDGGSNELEAAKECGMKPLQAVWYLKGLSGYQQDRKPEYINVESPLDVLNYI